MKDKASGYVHKIAVMLLFYVSFYLQAGTLTEHSI